MKLHFTPNFKIILKYLHWFTEYRYPGCSKCMRELRVWGCLRYAGVSVFAGWFFPCWGKFIFWHVLRGAVWLWACFALWGYSGGAGAGALGWGAAAYCVSCCGGVIISCGFLILWRQVFCCCCCFFIYFLFRGVGGVGAGR